MGALDFHVQGDSVGSPRLRSRTISFQAKNIDSVSATQSELTLSEGGAADGTGASRLSSVMRVQSATGSPRFASRLSPQSDA